jgi:hypothetical protein
VLNGLRVLRGIASVDGWEHVLASRPSLPSACCRAAEWATRWSRRLQVGQVASSMLGSPNASAHAHGTTINLPDLTDSKPEFAGGRYMTWPAVKQVLRRIVKEFHVIPGDAFGILLPD